MYINKQIRAHTSPIVIYSIHYIYNDAYPDKAVIDIEVQPRCDVITWMTIPDHNPIMYVSDERRTIAATIEEMQNALLNANNFEFDLVKVGIKNDDVSFDDLKEEYARSNQNKTLTNKDLTSFGLLTNDDYLTIAGYLFADKSSCKNANAVCTTRPTLNKGSKDYLDSKPVQGSIIEIFKTLIDYVSNVKFYSFGGLKDGLYRKDIGSFSINSLREAFVNAVAHRDYKIDGNNISLDCFPDRIEISSPGSMLQRGESIRNEKLESLVSLRRNQTICDMLSRCHLMEEKGSGFDLIIQDYQDLPEDYCPLYTTTNASFTLTLKNKQYNFGNQAIEDLKAESFKKKENYFLPRDVLKLKNPKYSLIEQQIKANPLSTYLDFEKCAGLSTSGVKYNLSQMKKAWLIERKGTNVSGLRVIISDNDRPQAFYNLDQDIQAQSLSYCQKLFKASKTPNLNT